MGFKVLMVCLGNICRSPLAQGILESKLDPTFFQVDSAGTASYHLGKKPDHRSIAVANKYGIDISHQRCRQFAARDFTEYDLIFAMDKSNYHNIIALARNNKEKAKVSLLLQATQLTHQEVPDPYYGGEDRFEEVYHLIDKACSAIARNLIQNTSN
ncbi:low molecular weight phosphotyrosine protein phosphatase [Arenibacter aquaticus]|uniref:protein-tyrosine-phosphatase n=1 Tax=Arenibacter aquaticus TaxID=2489054 RepID=A0A3S0ACU4_9FLAO|nr:low molecular weight protein-tyrosine-phosphatase [Arenibacter aquaticus]RTE52551.1 low molecular weight phosphotyrosine protein phosphatase [Arenibacter aquaticus]